MYTPRTPNPGVIQNILTSITHYDFVEQWDHEPNPGRTELRSGRGCLERKTSEILSTFSDVIPSSEAPSSPKPYRDMET